MNTEMTYYDIIFEYKERQIVYVEEQKEYVSSKNYRDFLLKEKQSLLEIKLLNLKGYQVKVVEKVLGTPNEYLVTNRTMR